MRDITESRLLREQLLQSEKMAAVGKLVSGVAHELNNPLTGVIGYAQLMLRKYERGNSSLPPDDVRSILSEAQRATRIVKNLLSFSRAYKPQRSLIDINQAIMTVIDLRAYEMSHSNVTVETALEPGLPRSMADLQQIEQVILNLLNNSVQAISDSGHAGLIGVNTGTKGDMVYITITDNGDGISPEEQLLIFDPFFTTREIGKGPGLGLSICYGIVEEHGGRILVESSEGNGTAITVELPAEAQIIESNADEEKRNGTHERNGIGHGG
jgi:two-component system NtrC family sensor kinase